jgi:hypothetical protein
MSSFCINYFIPCCEPWNLYHKEKNRNKKGEISKYVLLSNSIVYVCTVALMPGILFGS